MEAEVQLTVAMVSRRYIIDHLKLLYVIATLHQFKAYNTVHYRRFKQF